VVWLLLQKSKTALLGQFNDKLLNTDQLPAILKSSCILLKSQVVFAACIHLVSPVNRNGSKSLSNEGKSLM